MCILLSRACCESCIECRQCPFLAVLGRLWLRSGCVSDEAGSTGQPYAAFTCQRHWKSGQSARPNWQAHRHIRFEPRGGKGRQPMQLRFRLRGTTGCPRSFVESSTEQLPM